MKSLPLIIPSWMEKVEEKIEYELVISCRLIKSVNPVLLNSIGKMLKTQSIDEVNISIRKIS